MGFSAVYNTDVGIKKKTNQDSLAIKIADTPDGQVVFSLVLTHSLLRWLTTTASVKNC